MSDRTEGIGWRTKEAIIYTVTAIAITIGVLALAWLFNGMSERHQTTKAQQIEVCMEQAEGDVALLACRKTI